MNWFDRQLVWLAVLLLGGCATMSPPPSPPLEGPPGACPSWRWVALKADAASACPGLKEHLGPVQASNSSTRFCFYQGPDGSVGQRIQELRARKKLVQADRDCAALGSLGSEEETSLSMQGWSTLQGHFGVQVGRSELWDATADRRNVVRLAILDTQPKDLWRDRRAGRSPHGWSLAHIGRQLVCPDEGPALSGPCVAEVTTRLALPWRKLNPDHFRGTHLDERRGGYFGTLYDLAKAIDRELAEARGSGDLLVLNLSVGWDGEAFGGLENEVDEMPVPAQLLYRVLEDAACQGVLVVAAAGNRLGGPEPESGMLLPAAWAGRTVTCREGSQRRLLYAVAGVDGTSKPLSNARPEGMPELVAFADHAVVETFEPDLPTKTYTGSSVAAAVASAAAAAVWSERPEWAARQVMETLYDSGSELAKTADVVANPPLGPPAGVSRIAALSPLALAEEAAVRRGSVPPSSVHRICLQRALCEAQGADGAACRGVDQTCPESEPPALHLVLDARHAADVSGYTEAWSIAPAEGCKATQVLYMPTAERPSYSCPSDQFESVLARPWVGPQPQDPPCPNCTLEPPGTGGGDGLMAAEVGGSYTLYIEIDGDWSEPLYDSTLRLGETLLPLSLGVLNRGDRATVEGIESSLVNGADPVVLEFTVYEGSEKKSVESPVLVVR